MLIIIAGIVIMIIGVLMIVKTEWMLSNFGRIDWFEQKFGTAGGSRFGYKLVAIAAIFIGLLMATGSIEGFLNWVLSPLIRTMVR